MRLWRAALVIALVTVPAVITVPADSQSPVLPNEFFALDTAMVRHLERDLIQRSDLETLAELGYPGLAVVLPNAASWQHLSERILPWLDEKKLKLYAVYTWGQVERERLSLDPELKRSLRLLKDHGTVIWLPIRSREFQPSDPAADDLVVVLVREVADAAAQYGLRVSLYPHVGNLIERTSDAVRIAEKSGRKNVSVTLNLCHSLRADGADSMEGVIKLALPWLNLVTINGADRDGKEWIRPLDSGTLDVAAFIRKLHQLGYRGPIGLQGFSVAARYRIEPRENLSRSMAAWKKLSKLAIAGGSPQP